MACSWPSTSFLLLGSTVHYVDRDPHTSINKSSPCTQTGRFAASLDAHHSYLCLDSPSLHTSSAIQVIKIILVTNDSCMDFGLIANESGNINWKDAGAFLFVTLLNWHHIFCWSHDKVSSILSLSPSLGEQGYRHVLWEKKCWKNPPLWICTWLAINNHNYMWLCRGLLGICWALWAVSACLLGSNHNCQLRLKRNKSSSYQSLETLWVKTDNFIVFYSNIMKTIYIMSDLLYWQWRN